MSYTVSTIFIFFAIFIFGHLTTRIYLNKNWSINQIFSKESKSHRINLI
jgi:hypothetical protein